jgi:hypothetical protein
MNLDFEEMHDVVAVRAKNHTEHWKVWLRDVGYPQQKWCVVKAVLPVGVDPETAQDWDYGTGMPIDGETEDHILAMRWYLTEVRAMIYNSWLERWNA